LNEKTGSVLVVGAGFIGVEWVTELQHFFPKLHLAICDMLKRCLGPLPENAAVYCEKYMRRKNIAQIYGPEEGKFSNPPTDAEKARTGLKKLDGTPGWDKDYVCIGVKASNYFMPADTLSKFGPGGGKWILMDQTLAVCKVVETGEAKGAIASDGKVGKLQRWSVDEKGYGRIYAVGDCNYGCVEIPPDDEDLLREATGTMSGKFLAGARATTSGTITVPAEEQPSTEDPKPGAAKPRPVYKPKCVFKRFDEVTIAGNKYEIMACSQPKISTVHLTYDFHVEMNLKGPETPPTDNTVTKVKGAGRSKNAWPVPPIPKISYPGEEEAVIACANIHRIEKLKKGKTVDCCYTPLQPAKMHWPWGAGMFATSLGPDTACFVAGANWNANSGLKCVWGPPCAVQKEIIEASKTDECANGVIGRMIWHFVHHTPVHLFGGGPRWGF